MARRHPIDKIMKDWNGGMNSHDLSEKYDLGGSVCVHNLIKAWRKRGYNFNRRYQPRCHIKERRQLTAIRRKVKNAGLYIGADHWQD